ncbi:MAG: DUF5808 domain-containing protein [Ignavibacteriaceae bacterium]|nr:DUF5808 domain-containing protein [Ignavibacteriaceae bacterium]
MNSSQLFIYSIIFLVVLISAVTFYNTIITKKWRNKVINESECWKWGMFYYNPLDKRIFLPKRTGLGLTLNFAHPVSTILMVALVLIIIISMIFPYKK